MARNGNGGSKHGNDHGNDACYVAILDFAIFEPDRCAFSFCVDAYAMTIWLSVGTHQQYQPGGATIRPCTMIPFFYVLGGLTEPGLGGTCLIALSALQRFEQSLIQI